MSPAKLAIFCGGGALPREVAAGARACGREPLLLHLQGVTDADLAGFEVERLRMGEVGKLFAVLAKQGVSELVLVGAMTRPDWRDLRLDWGALKRADNLARLFTGGDDALLKGIIAMIEREGVKVVGALDVAPGLAAEPGALGRIAPTSSDLEAARHGLALLAATAPFDLGQSCVVLEGRVVAVEGAEGTDAMLARVATLKAEGRLAGKGRAGVFVKAAKKGQDFRVDLPSIGPATIAAARRASLST